MLRQYPGSNQLKSNSGDRTWYFMMNLTQPPFDDIHIRKAVNWVVNREALRKAWGGPFAGTIATHIAPDNMLADKLKGYAPYGSGKGDVAKAKAEVKLSKYDKNHDGICDAKACKNIFTISGDRSVEKTMLPTLEQNLKSIGMTLKDRVLKDAYTPIGTVRLNTPFSTRPGWGKDYADPYAFFGANFDSRAITPTGNGNRGLVGLTPALAKKFGVKGDDHRHPERRQGPRQLPDQARGRAPRVLRRARQEAHDAGRPVGPVPLGELHQRHQQECHAVAVRSVQRRDRLRPRGGQVI